MGVLLDDEFWNSNGIKKKKILDIINEVGKDDRLKNVVKYTDSRKLGKFLTERLDVIRDYAQSWSVPETEDGIQEALHELYEASVLAYGATAQRPDKETIRIDFFLAHGLTSVLFVYILLPYLETKNQIKLLREHFASVLCYYISRGSPQLHLDLLYNYVPKTLSSDPNPWLDIIKRALEIEECHIIKAVRSLLKAEQLWGAGEHNIFLKTAQVTVEGFQKYDWSKGGIGWEEEWEAGANTGLTS